MKKQLAIIMSIACVAALIVGYIVIRNRFSISEKQSSLTQKEVWQQYHAKKCSEITLAIKKAFNIPDDWWADTYTIIETLKKNDPLFSPVQTSNKHRGKHPLIDLVCRLLLENGLNPDAVIITIDPNAEGPAFAHQTCPDSQKVISKITLNPHEMSKRPADAQEAILRHEIQHLVHYDPIEEGYILGLLKDVGYTYDKVANHPLLMQLHHAKEYRADQMAAIQTDVSIAKAMIKELAAMNTPATISHPATNTRVAQINVVVNHLKT